MRRIPAVAAAAAALLLAGCSSTTPAPQPPASPAEPSAHGGLAECLKSHGVADSGGTAVVLGPPAGVDPGAWDTAMKECNALAPGPATP